MKSYIQRTSIAAAAMSLIGVSSAFAGNITIADNNSGSDVYGTHYVESNNPTDWYKGNALTGPSTEYQEVEPGMQTGAVWDLAAFVNPSAGRLGIISGYNLATGYDSTTIGDIFISTNPGGLTGYADPNSPYPTYVRDSEFHFDFAIHMDFGAGTYSVIQLDANTVIQNGEYSGGNGYYNAASQPWKVATTLAGTGFTSGTGTLHGDLGTVITTGALTYTSSLSTATALSLSGISMTSDYKYYAEVGTSWLQPYLNSTNPVALYKLTMECGNDNMIGLQTSGFNQVPDGSATLSLLGFGVLALAGVANSRARKNRILVGMQN